MGRKVVRFYPIDRIRSIIQAAIAGREPFRGWKRPPRRERNTGSMFNKIKTALGLDPIQKKLDDLIGKVPAINALEEAFERLSDEELSAKTAEFRSRLADGETLDELLPEAFATIRETSKRVLGMRPYDVQLIGGMALHDKSIAEMRTGEGKTLSATLPVYLNALAGKGVHLITVNDYLARRDARWMAPVYNFLNLSVGVLQMAARTENGKKAFLVDLTVSSVKEDQDRLRMVPRREAYLADITYGTNAEFGFDYLRDNMTMNYDDRVQRGHAFALIDEVDNVLIDEARTPLIISGPASDDVEMYHRMAAIIRELTPDEYEVSEKDHQVYINDAGLDHVEALLGMTLRDPARPEEITLRQEAIMGYIDQALKAEFLYHRNKEYLVQGGKVVIVDSFTGRLMPGRRWSNGLHQAIEAKEGVKVEPENVTYATITLQNYYRMYDKICGMTGTALTEKEEFYKIYGLDVIPVPTNLEFSARQKNSELIERTAKDETGFKYTFYALRSDPETPVYFKRKDYEDVIYQSEEAKFRAITVEILRNYILGRPQLIGTASVEHSEYLASRLKPEPLRRLIQLNMLRRVWMIRNKIEYVESPIKQFDPFRKAIETIGANDIRPFARELGVSLNPDDPENKAFLLAEFELTESEYPRFLATVESGIRPQVLNARKHDEEGMIIAQAGAFGAVTIATNMAGRGVDIKLGGELDEATLRDVNRVLVHSGVDPYNLTNDGRYEELSRLDEADFGVYEESVARFRTYIENMHKVRELGGLHVIGSERHESRRIDNQLRGRAARQGDPGSSRFFLSLQDEIVRLFGGAQVENLLNRVNLLDESVPMEHGMFSRLIEQSQERVEGSNFDVRKHTLEYDDVLNSQRKRIYDQRDQAFLKKDLSEDIYDILETDLDARLEKYGEEENWQLAAYFDSVQPPFEIDGNFLPAFTTQLLINELNREIAFDVPEADAPASPEREEARREAILEELLTLSRKAFEAENKIGLDQAEALIANARAGFDAQSDERRANFELFAEALADRLKSRAEGERDGEIQTPLRGQDLLAEAGSFARINFRLSSEDQRLLTDGDETVLDKLRGQIESTLFTVFTARTHQAFLKRLGDDYVPPAETPENWDDFGDAVMNAVSEGFLKRADRLFGEQDQIRADLNAALRSIPGEALRYGLNDRQWNALLRAAGQGKRIAFDAKTHRKTSVAYTRLNFLYYSGTLLDGKSRQEIRDLVWDHYLTTLERLRAVFGEIDWKRLRNHSIPLDQLRAETQAQLKTLLGADVYGGIAALPPTEIDEDCVEKIKDHSGGRIQNEICRMVILRAITDQWVHYLTEIESLRVRISMEAYAQRNPLVVYKTRAAELFSELLKNIRRAVVERIFITAPTLGMLTASERVSLNELRKDQERALPAEEDLTKAEADEAEARPEPGGKPEGGDAEEKPSTAALKKKKKKMKR